MLRAAFAALAVLSLAASASAQQSTPADPVIAGYREFLAAQKRNDPVAAERAAERAWRASEAQSGDGGKTAVLAFNTAVARLSLPRANAVEPARRAADLAAKGADGLDIVRARLVLGRALLIDDYPEGKKILRVALEQARQAKHLERSETYYAAVALADAAAFELDWPVASQTWSVALDFADSGPGEIDVLRAQALLGRGVAMAGQHQDAEALQSMLRAVRLLAPFAPEREGDLISIGEQYYAEAFGWASAIAARLRAQGKPVADFAIVRTALPGKAPLCSVQVQVEPKPQNPLEPGDKFGFASFTMKLNVDSAGRVLGGRFVASNPLSNFAPEWLDNKSRWRVKPAGGAKAGCRLDSADHIVTIAFAR